MIAALPMYDRPENAAAHDALWAGLRDILGYGPDRLDRETAYDATWARPDLLLGQICNLPYRTRFRDRLIPLGSADYGLPDTPAGYYHSVFVTRVEDAPRGLAPALLGRFAYNDAMSHSGWGAAQAYVAKRGLTFHTTLQTGSHLESLRAICDGRADLAAIDAVTWRNLQTYDPVTRDLRSIGRSGLSPGMTFVTARAFDPEPIRNALHAALEHLAPDHRATLGLRSVTLLPETAFDIPLVKMPA